MAAAERPNPQSAPAAVGAIGQPAPADGDGLEYGSGVIPQSAPADGGRPEYGGAIGRPAPADGGGGDAWLVYDGECPLCSAYARRVASAAGDAGGITLVDARSGGPPVAELRRRAYDPDAGMTLKLGGQYYHGSAALHRLAQLSAGRGALGMANRLLFRHRPAARLCYPLLQAGRRLLLRLRSIKN